MTAEQAAELFAVLRPKLAVPIHYAFTAGRVRDRLFLKYDGTPERFERAAADHAPLPRSESCPQASPSPWDRRREQRVPADSQPVNSPRCDDSGELVTTAPVPRRE
jgi:hypothetical protein